jgi:hypothetical protein
MFSRWHPIRLTVFLLLIGIGPLSQKLNAQMRDIQTELQWGSLEKGPSGSYITKVVAAGEWGAFLLRYRPARGFNKELYWLEEFDTRFGLRARHEVNLSPKGADLEDIISLRGQLYLITSRTVAEATQVFARPLSPRAQVTGTEKLLADMDKDEKFRRNQFDIEYSRDSSHLLLYNQLPPEKEGPERFTLRVFSDDFSLLWSRDVILPYRDQGFSIRSYQVDTDGNVYLLCRQVTGTKEDRIPPKYMVYAYRRNGQEEIAYQLDIEGISFLNLRLELAGNGDLVCAGLYGIGGQVGSKGIGHIRINPLTKEASKVDLLPFPETFLEQAGQSLQRGTAPVLIRYQLRDLTLRSDGGIVLVAEQFFRQNRTEMSPMTGPQFTSFDNYNDILIANIAPDGTYTWLKRIPKRQETPNDRGAISSFTQVTVQDRFIFLYNDNPENFNPDSKRISEMDGRDAVLALSEIRRDGELNTIPLYVSKDADVITYPRRCHQIGARLVLIYGEDGRDYRLGLLKL